MPLVGSLLGLLIHKGLNCGNYLEEWIRGLLKAKGKTKFKDVSVRRQSRLKIIAGCYAKGNPDPSGRPHQIWYESNGI